MKVWLTTCALGGLLLDSLIAQSQELSIEPDKKPAGVVRELPGITIEVHVPPSGLDFDLPLEPGKVTALQFDVPIRRGIGIPRGYEIRVVEKEQRVDVWVLPDKKPEEPLSGNAVIVMPDRNLNVEPHVRKALEDRVRIVKVVRSPDPKDAELAKTTQNLAKTRRDLETSKGETAAAQADAAQAKEEAARARGDAAKAKSAVAKAKRETAVAKADAAKAREEVAQAQAQLVAVRQQSVVDIAKAKSDTKQEAADAMLVVAAKELIDPNSHRLSPEYKKAKLEDGAPLLVEYDGASWSQDHLLVAMGLAIPNTTPYRLADAQVRAPNGKLLPTKVVYPTTKEDSEQGIIRRIQDGERVQLVVSIEDAMNFSDGGLSIHLSEPHGARSVVAAIPRWEGIRYPESDEHERLRLERERRERLGKQVILGPSGGIASCWLAESSGSTNLDSMACYSLGARFTYGIVEMLALEVEGLGGWTASDEMRSAKFGRATIGGVVRLGTDTIPYVRAGIGVQAGKVDGSSEVGFLLSIGAGVDRRLSTNLLIGVGLAGERMQGDETMFRQAIGIGIHLSIGWDRSAAPQPE